MKFITEFREQKHFTKLLGLIEQAANPKIGYRFMEFCGGHTHAIFRYGISQRLPENITMVHGPGCPVCVMPSGRIDQAISLASQPNIILCSYGDMLRVPGSRGNNLIKAKAQGANVRMVYSAMDSLAVAQQNPQQQIVFFAVGFETTAPGTALAVQSASQHKLTNFSVLCNHLLTPPAIDFILATEQEVTIDGFLGPAHVSTIIGSEAYAPFVAQYKKPVVITGFEPVDILQGILMLILQCNQQQAKLQNQYTRAVSPQGNHIAQQLIADYLTLRETFYWRGLGSLLHSSLTLHASYQHFDAEHKFTLKELPNKEHAACQCGAILRGIKQPQDCKIFAKSCTPDTPVGPCMVSSEGTCSAYYHYSYSDTI